MVLMGLPPNVLRAMNFTGPGTVSSRPWVRKNATFAGLRTTDSQEHVHISTRSLSCAQCMRRSRSALSLMSSRSWQRRRLQASLAISTKDDEEKKRRLRGTRRRCEQSRTERHCPLRQNDKQPQASPRPRYGDHDHRFNLPH